MWQQLLNNFKQGDIKALARTISLVENEHEGYFEFLQQLPASPTPLIGITGPPGAGKSTLVDALVGQMVAQQKKVAVVCVDPSSPFNLGALLGDRIRMSQWYNNPNVYIRSLATRGSLGGLHPKIIEICDVVRTALFDYVIVETVGVGQSEVEIAGLADCTMVVVVPEAGDEVQTMKAGLMEIADIFVVNKADRPGAAKFVHNLRQIATTTGAHNTTPVLKTVATTNTGIAQLFNSIVEQLAVTNRQNRRTLLLVQRAYFLIAQYRMHNVKKEDLKQAINKQVNSGMPFNLYKFVNQYLGG